MGLVSLGWFILGDFRTGIWQFETCCVRLGTVSILFFLPYIVISCATISVHCEYCPRNLWHRRRGTQIGKRLRYRRWHRFLIFYMITPFVFHCDIYFI